MSRVLVWAMLSLLVGCSSNSFSVKSLIKSDVDMVADIHYQQAQKLMHDLTEKLYRRNTAEWRKSGLSLEQLQDQILFPEYEELRHKSLGSREGIDAIELALNPDYRGDRVFALMAGMNFMLRKAYSFNNEFFLFSSIDAQKLHNSARNVEILVWRLSHRMLPNGKPVLLTNSLPGETPNLSFERLFGQLIANQDTLSLIVAQKNQRLIKSMVQNAASMVFIPI